MARSSRVLRRRSGRGASIGTNTCAMAMNTENDSIPPPGDSPPPVQQQQQQQPQGGSGGHAGQGSESALRQMQAWEKSRAANSGGKRRQSPV